jgi:hypothetical protein
MTGNVKFYNKVKGKMLNGKGLKSPKKNRGFKVSEGEKWNKVFTTFYSQRSTFGTKTT